MTSIPEVTKWTELGELNALLPMLTSRAARRALIQKLTKPKPAVVFAGTGSLLKTTIDVEQALCAVLIEIGEELEMSAGIGDDEWDLLTHICTLGNTVWEHLDVVKMTTPDQEMWDLLKPFERTIRRRLQFYDALHEELLAASSADKRKELFQRLSESEFELPALEQLDRELATSPILHPADFKRVYL